MLIVIRLWQCLPEGLAQSSGEGWLKCKPLCTASLWAARPHHQSGRTWDTGRNAAQRPGEPGTDSEADASAHIPVPVPHCQLSLMLSPFPLPLPPVEPGKAVCLPLRAPCSPALATGPTLFKEANWKMSWAFLFIKDLAFTVEVLAPKSRGSPLPFCRGYFESHSQAMASWPSVASVLPQKLWLPWFRGEMSH